MHLTTLHLLVQKRCFEFAVSTITHERNTQEHAASFAFDTKNKDGEREINTHRAKGTLLPVTHCCPPRVRRQKSYTVPTSTLVRCRGGRNQAWLDERLFSYCRFLPGPEKAGTAESAPGWCLHGAQRTGQMVPGHGTAVVTVRPLTSPGASLNYSKGWIRRRRGHG